MSGSTTKLSLYLPGGGSSGNYGADEVADIDQLNANFVKIDNFAAGVVSYSAVDGTSLLTYNNVLTVRNRTMITKIGGSLVILVAEFQTTAALGGDGVLINLPTGYRPIITTDSDFKCTATSQRGGNWGTTPCYVRNSDFTLRIQGSTSLATGDVIAIQLAYIASSA